MSSKDETVRPCVSACANASLQADIERVRKMTVEERILAAFSMKSKFAWLQPSSVEKQGNEFS